MNEEIAKVLTMVQEGKIDSDKASELIEVLREKAAVPAVAAPEKSKDYTDKMLKIRVVSSDNDNVSVNLPIKLVKAVLKVGHSIAGNIPQAEKYIKDINMDLLIDAIDNELDGQIVDIKSSDGDLVAVIIE